ALPISCLSGMQVTANRYPRTIHSSPSAVDNDSMPTTAGIFQSLRNNNPVFGNALSRYPASRNVALK
ncbi:MAG: hypothetical protein RIA65_13525, partial [Woeseia sp.]